MTKRLTALGFAAVAVVWGPYVYAELARKPLPTEPVEPPAPVIEATPAAYVSPATERAQLLAALAAAREKAAAEPDEAITEPDAPELPGDAPLAAAPPAENSAPTEPPPAVAELPHVQPPQPAAADPAAHPAQPAAALAEQEAPVAEAPVAEAPAAEAPVAEAPAAEALAAKDESADAQHAAPAHEEPSDERHEETTKEKHEETKHATSDEAATPENLAPAFRSTFDRESRDVAWANGEEPRLAKLLAGAGIPESAISEVRCQSTVCRIALNSVDLKAIQQSPLYQVISARVKDEFGTLGLDAMGEGEQHAAVYVLRKGYELEHGRDTN